MELQRPCGARHRHRGQGFTLAELLITLTIGAVLAGAAIPAFSHLIAADRIKTAVDTFISHVQLARFEAITRDQRVTLCPSGDAMNCLTTPDWHRGLLLFVDLDRDREHDAGEPVLRVSSALDGTVTLTSSTARKRIVYEADGTALGGSNGTFRFCDSSGEAEPRTVIISLAGRLRTATTEPDGSPVKCP